MAFCLSMDKAALQHFLAAEYLLNEKENLRNVAGYLYGIAAECAVKYIILHSEIRHIFPRGRDKQNPIYAHFPDIKRLLLNNIQGRKAHVLQQVITVQFMSEWDISIRYAPSHSIKSAMVTRWQKQAKDIISAMHEFQ